MIHDMIWSPVVIQRDTQAWGLTGRPKSKEDIHPKIRVRTRHKHNINNVYIKCETFPKSPALLVMSFHLIGDRLSHRRNPTHLLPPR